MAALITKNVIKQILKDIATAHYQINSFGYGDTAEMTEKQWEYVGPEMVLEERRQYPILWVQPTTCNIQGKTMFYGYDILVADLVQKGEGNEVDVESDTLQMLTDVIALLDNKYYGFQLDRSQMGMDPFWEKSPDELTGHAASIQLKVGFTYDQCQVPGAFIAVTNPYEPFEGGSNEQDPLSWHKLGNTIAEPSNILGSNNDVGWYIRSNGVNRWEVQNDGDIVPVLSETYNIGAAASLIDNIYVKTLHYTTLDPSITLTWGSITGTLSSQLDLQAALDAKITKAGDSGIGNLTFNAGATLDVPSGALNLGTVNAVAVNLATGAANTLVNIGTSGNNVINIGNTLSTINLIGTVINQNVVNLNVADKLITLNDGGAAGSGSGVGFEVEENAVATGYLKTTGGRDGWLLKAPANAFESSFIFNPGAARSYTFPDASGTVALMTSLSATSPIFYNSGTGVISSQAAGAAAGGYVTTGAQTIAGTKTFSSAPILSSLSAANSAVLLGGSGTAVNGSDALRFQTNELIFAQTNTNFSIKTVASSGVYLTSWLNPSSSADDLFIGRAVNSSFSGAVNWIKINKSGTIDLGTTNTARLTINTNGNLTIAKGIIMGITSTAISYGVLTTDHTVKVTASGVTITLETAVGNTGQIHFIKNASSGTITLTTTSSQTIFLTSALTSYTLNAGDSYGVQSDGANWIVI